MMQQRVTSPKEIERDTGSSVDGAIKLSWLSYSAITAYPWTCENIYMQATHDKSMAGETVHIYDKQTPNVWLANIGENLHVNDERATWMFFRILQTIDTSFLLVFAIFKQHISLFCVLTYLVGIVAWRRFLHSLNCETECEMSCDSDVNDITMELKVMQYTPSSSVFRSLVSEYMLERFMCFAFLTK